MREKNIIILVIGLVLLCAVGIGGYMAVSHNSSNNTTNNTTQINMTENNTTEMNTTNTTDDNTQVTQKQTQKQTQNQATQKKQSTKKQDSNYEEVIVPGTGGQSVKAKHVGLTGDGNKYVTSDGKTFYT